MREVFSEIRMETAEFNLGLDWERVVAAKVWKKFYEERDKGTFKIRVFFFQKDISGDVAKLLTKWFGADPNLR